MANTAGREVAASDVALSVIALERIREGTNVRESLPDIAELAKSIKQHGVLTAVLVTKRDDGEYDLVAGFRRVAAARAAGLSAIPAVIREAGSALDRIGDQLAENDDRVGLNELDVAGAMQQMLDVGATRKDVAKRFDCSVDAIDTWRGILALPAVIRERVRDGLMTADDAAELVPIADDTELINRVVEEVEAGLSPLYAIRQARATVERQTREQTARAKLEGEKCPLVEAPKWGVISANSKMQKLGEGVKVPLRKHRPLGCHAAYIDFNGKGVYVCTNRGNHAGQDGSGVPDLKALRAEKKAAKAALLAAHDARKSAWQSLVHGDLPDRTLCVQHVLHLLIRDTEPRVLSGVCERLNLPVEERSWQHDEVATVTNYIGDDDDRLVRVSILIGVVRGERAMTEEKGRYETGYVVRAFLPFLEKAVGYTAQPTEKTRAAERGRSYRESGLPPILGGNAPDAAEPSEEDGI